MAQLPSYINPTQNRGVAQRALANAPISSPPYLSIKGNRFTLVDAAGNTRQFQTLYADIVVTDVNDHLSKIYFPDAYQEGDATPPLCFSDNGVAPSRNAGQPQSPTCASCRWGEWGSKVSNMGSRIKACTDVQKICVIVPGIPGQEFLLRIPPNSLKNWGGYLSTFRYGYDISDVVTRLTFQEGVQGTLEFSPAPDAFFDAPAWAQCYLLQAREQAWSNPGVRAMIGATDVPAEGLVGGPGFRGSPGALPAGALAPPIQTHQIAAQPGFQPSAAAPAPTAGSQSTGMVSQPQFAPAATASSPSNPLIGGQAQQPGRRRRRTQAEIAADQPHGGALVAPFPHSLTGGQAQQPQSGFVPAPGPGPAATGPAFASTVSATGGGPQFGIGAGVSPDPAMEKMLQDTFGPGFRGSPAGGGQ